jgi:hypothetical protein
VLSLLIRKQPVCAARRPLTSRATSSACLLQLPTGTTPAVKLALPRRRAWLHVIDDEQCCSRSLRMCRLIRKGAVAPPRQHRSVRPMLYWCCGRSAGRLGLRNDQLQRRIWRPRQRGAEQPRQAIERLNIICGGIGAQHHLHREKPASCETRSVVCQEHGKLQDSRHKYAREPYESRTNK